MLETARYVVVSCKLHYATDATTVERCVQYYLILYIKWNLVVRGRRFLCTYRTVLAVQILFENYFRRFRSRSLQRIDF